MLCNMTSFCLMFYKIMRDFVKRLNQKILSSPIIEAILINDILLVFLTGIIKAIC